MRPRPPYPFAPNRRSPHAKGLALWYPVPAFGGGERVGDPLGLGPQLAHTGTWALDAEHGWMLDFSGGSTIAAPAASAPVVPIAPGFSILFWAKPPNASEASMMISSRVAPSYVQWDVGFTASDPFFWTSGKKLSFAVISAPTSHQAYTDDDYADGQLHHFAVVYLGTSTLIYVDGRSVPVTQPSTTSMTLTPSGITTLGRDEQSTFPYGGQIGDVRVYNRAVGGGEVWNQYTNPWELYEGPTARPRPYSVPVVAAAGGGMLLRGVG